MVQNNTKSAKFGVFVLVFRTIIHFDILNAIFAKKSRLNKK